MHELLSGDEAIARGAFEAGVRVGTAYPGTPSTEILENLRRYPGVYVEWSVNEKVALEVGMGAAFCGARVLVAMKHVGVNVAADPLMTLAYTGTKGGLVLVSADDPGLHSSQNEQDNRYYAKFAQIPMLEPADSQEAKEMTKVAFEVSERFDTPVLFRVTTRVCHSKSIATLEEPQPSTMPIKFDRNRAKYVMVPGHAYRRHKIMLERWPQLVEYAEQSLFNRIEPGDPEFGIITSGVAYQYAREVCPTASFLKLGFTNPLPATVIRKFARSVKRVLVIEELEPYLAEQIRALGLQVEDKPTAFRLGELNPERVRQIIFPDVPVKELIPPAQPPVLCAGCPHRAVYVTLRKLRIVTTGDIGCYTLGALPPLENVDTCVCMGAGIGQAHGFSKVLPAADQKKVVAVIGDSTFFHSGMTSLLNMVYNQSNATVIILDNRTTAMTGHQEHPGTGKTIRGEPAPEIKVEDVCRGVGVQHIQTVYPYHLGEVEQAIKAATEYPGPSVIVARAPCILAVPKGETFLAIDPATCHKCGICQKVGCPAIEWNEETEEYRINEEMCRACTVCQQVCPKHSISEVKPQ